MLQRFRIEVDGATPADVYEQLDYYHANFLEMQSNRLQDRRPIDSEVTEDIVELVLDKQYEDYEQKPSVTHETKYVGRRVVAVHPNIAPAHADEPWETPTWTNTANTASSEDPTDLSEAQRILYNVIQEPETVGAPEINFQNFEWEITVRRHASGKDDVLHAKGVSLLEVAKDLDAQRHAIWQRDAAARSEAVSS